MASFGNTESKSSSNRFKLLSYPALAEFRSDDEAGSGEVAVFVYDPHSKGGTLKMLSADEAAQLGITDEDSSYIVMLNDSGKIIGAKKTHIVFCSNKYVGNFINIKGYKIYHGQLTLFYGIDNDLLSRTVGIRLDDIEQARESYRGARQDIESFVSVFQNKKSSYDNSQVFVIPDEKSKLLFPHPDSRHWKIRDRRISNSYLRLLLERIISDKITFFILPLAIIQDDRVKGLKMECPVIKGGAEDLLGRYVWTDQTYVDLPNEFLSWNSYGFFLLPIWHYKAWLPDMRDKILQNPNVFIGKALCGTFVLSDDIEVAYNRRCSDCDAIHMTGDDFIGFLRDNFTDVKDLSNYGLLLLSYFYIRDVASVIDPFRQHQEKDIDYITKLFTDRLKNYFNDSLYNVKNIRETLPLLINDMVRTDTGGMGTLYLIKRLMLSDPLWEALLPYGSYALSLLSDEDLRLVRKYVFRTLSFLSSNYKHAYKGTYKEQEISIKTRFKVRDLDVSLYELFSQVAYINRDGVAHVDGYTNTVDILIDEDRKNTDDVKNSYDLIYKTGKSFSEDDEELAIYHYINSCPVCLHSFVESPLHQVIHPEDYVNQKVKDLLQSLKIKDIIKSKESLETVVEQIKSTKGIYNANSSYRGKELGTHVKLSFTYQSEIRCPHCDARMIQEAEFVIDYPVSKSTINEEHYYNDDILTITKKYRLKSLDNLKERLNRKVLLSKELDDFIKEGLNATIPDPKFVVYSSIIERIVFYPYSYYNPQVSLQLLGQLLDVNIRDKSMDSISASYNWDVPKITSHRVIRYLKNEGFKLDDNLVNLIEEPDKKQFQRYRAMIAVIMGLLSPAIYGRYFYEMPLSDKKLYNLYEYLKELIRRERLDFLPEEDEQRLNLKYDFLKRVLGEGIGGSWDLIADVLFGFQIRNNIEFLKRDIINPIRQYYEDSNNNANMPSEIKKVLNLIDKELDRVNKTIDPDNKYLVITIYTPRSDVATPKIYNLIKMMTYDDIDVPAGYFWIPYYKQVVIRIPRYLERSIRESMLEGFRAIFL